MFNFFKKNNKPVTATVEAPTVEAATLEGPSAFLKFMVERLVDNPGDVSVKEVDGERSTILELNVNEEDMGKVIGKKGRIIKSLRIVVRAAAVHEGKNISIELVK